MKNEVLKIGIVAVAAFLLVFSFTGCDSALVSETTTTLMQTTVRIPDEEKVAVASLECFLGIKAKEKTYSDDGMKCTLRFASAFDKYPEQAIDDYAELLKSKYNLVEKDAESQKSSSLLRLYDPETDRCIVDVTSSTFVSSDRFDNLTGSFDEKIKEEAMKKANSILDTYFEVCFSSYALIQDKEQWDGNICLYLADSSYKQTDCTYCNKGECSRCYGDGRVPDFEGGQTECSECDGTGNCKKCINGTNETGELNEFEYFYNPSDWEDCPVCGGDGLYCIFCLSLGDSDGHVCSSAQLCKQEDCVAGKVRKQK